MDSEQFPRVHTDTESRSGKTFTTSAKSSFFPDLGTMSARNRELSNIVDYFNIPKEKQADT